MGNNYKILILILGIIIAILGVATFILGVVSGLMWDWGIIGFIAGLGITLNGITLIFISRNHSK